MGAGKVVTLAEAVERYVGPSCGLLGLGGMHMHNNPMSLVREVIRQERHVGRLFGGPSASLGADLLVGAGLVREIIVSYVGFEHLGLAPCLRRAAQTGAVHVIECDEAGATHGLYAGAGGLPFVPLPPGLELSDVWRASPELYRTVLDPFTGTTAVAMRALRPDVAFVHAEAADAAGDAVLAGAPFTDRLLCQASRHVVLQVERIVPEDALVGLPAGTTLPGFLIDAVVEAPGGCYPTAAHGAYGYDEDHLRAYVAAGAQHDTWLGYLHANVTETAEPAFLAAHAQRIRDLARQSFEPAGLPSA